MSTQNALVVSEIGKPLTKVTRPIPSPKEVNPHDQKVRDRGLFLRGNLPAIIVNDIAGEVESIGANVQDFSIGDRVFGQSRLSIDTGGLQQYALLDAIFTARIPHNISDDEASTLPINGISIFVAMFHSTGLGIPPPIPSNEEAKTFDYGAQTLVIIGGGSNTGKLGIQFAHLAGTGNIIVVAGLGNTDELKSYGATTVIDRHVSNKEIKSQI